MEERLKQLDADADVTCFGQELNPFTFGIAKADMLIRGGDPDNMQFGDTLDDDKFDGYQFDYCISNPPFGIDWKREATAVEAEHKKGFRWSLRSRPPQQKRRADAVPAQRSVQTGKPEGRMAIIQNGSSLFTGDASSGQSEIRRYLIENDWLDAIVQLPNDSFYNTGIATYIWIITKDKPSEHIGRVQLIDASKCYESRRKPIGNKRVDITEACRELIVRAYGEYRDQTCERELESGAKLVCKSRVLDSVALGYNKITVESPLLDEDGKKVLKKGKPVADPKSGTRRMCRWTRTSMHTLHMKSCPITRIPGSTRARLRLAMRFLSPALPTSTKEVEPADQIAKRIEEHERALMQKLHDLFGKEGE
ncbi:MAG: class I SAM-dependent DNA methyltransferase [[Clostridium] scindens]